MITIKGGSIVNCRTVFRLGNNSTLDIDSLFIDNCRTVYDIDSQNSNINIYAKSLNVTNTHTFIAVAEQTAESPTFSPQIDNQIPHFLLEFSDENYAMRIAKQYINSTSEIHKK
ncbi:hypothetical protein [Vibrio spartinae]|uniref:Uncharacterized protein n=1 Tax=Vibrio spartinae TaxID=1918945 RepID=A0A1N6M000_9VIBR|nr:hypothetical protein [Vibrio spartinae]SIO92764.1 hypothetical protein VSP9026_00384 [Vibrio spartinae]